MTGKPMTGAPMSSAPMSDAPYDQSARRETPLALKLKDRIARHGPITVADFMRACLQDPEHGYYVRQPAIGAKGDFITAPEISQVFGELIGMWAAVVGQQMGSPEKLNLVELGPGRGTLMKDALRVTTRVKPFADAVWVTLVETSKTLQAAQRATLSGVSTPVCWTRDLAGIAAPAIILANEFLDALPVEQWLQTHDGWRERGVGLDQSNALCYVTLSAAPTNSCPGGSLGPDPTTHRSAGCGGGGEIADAPPGSIFETMRPELFANSLQALARSGAVAALLVDYGHGESCVGETLQAVRNHRFESPFTAPGEADLSSHVDFAGLARACRAAGLAVDGPITQAEFLGRLGLIERASKLMSANPAKVGEIETGVARLMAPTGMGSRFKVIGVRSVGLPVLPGFEPEFDQAALASYGSPTRPNSI